jgi:hypothetical protein
MEYFGEFLGNFDFANISQIVRAAAEKSFGAQNVSGLNFGSLA